MEPNIFQYIEGNTFGPEETLQNLNVNGTENIPILLDLGTLTPDLREQYEHHRSDEHGIR